MKTAYILFRSRNELVSFQRVLQSYNVACETVNAPRSMTTGCSLALKTMPENIEIAKQIAQRRNFSGLNGIYILDRNYGQRDFVSKIF